MANQMFVIMLRGLTTKWKQPLGYFYAYHSIHSLKLCSILMRALCACHEAGVTVPAVVCDMEVQQQQLAFNCLLVSEAKPFFLHPVTGAPVFFFFDPPHLLKALRNNFVKYDVKFSDGKTAK
jgi:hypothetical protein